MADKRVIGLMAKNAYTGTRDFLRGFVEAHFAIPSAMRKFDEEPRRGYDAGVVIPFAGSVMLGIYPISLYGCLFYNNAELGWTFLGTQVATNTASGLYEWYRYEKKKFDASNPQPQRKNLEKKVTPQTPSAVQETPSALAGVRNYVSGLPKVVGNLFR